ncbi:ABC transporter substrate-binding protein [Fodinicurvata sp. EGI_FJ10296]|uniref:ABC transporter substrate-binding protein n=1 Tax=Fodinicurvata sp. EGI_FJ10296 TaxID=3231908 RepID=UPI003453A1C7
MKRQKLLGLAAAGALLTAGTAHSQDIEVGHLADLTGATSAIGVEYALGVRHALEWLNEQGGVDGRQINFETVDYSYQAPRAVSTYRRWAGRGVVSILGWGTADTEALVDSVTQDEIPYISASYAGTLTDPTGDAPRSTKGAPYNFFYGPSYSDACRGLVSWAADDWAEQGEDRAPRFVHMGANHPFPNSPKAACAEYAEELGFEVLSEITYSLAPEDFSSQCLTLNRNEADYAYIANTVDSTTSLLNACAGAEVDVQFLSGVWGLDENVMRSAGQNADGVVLAVRTGATWTDTDVPGIQLINEISDMQDETGEMYRPLSYLAGVCASMYMAEAMEIAAESGDITGPAIRDAFYERSDWVPEGFEGVCLPSNWSPEDHRGMMTVPIYRASVTEDVQGREVRELIDAGAMELQHLTTVELPRREEWLGY